MAESLRSLNRVLLLGTGPMGRDYAKALREGLRIPFHVAGRTPSVLEKWCTEEGAAGLLSLKDLSEKEISTFDFIVVATAMESLSAVTEFLLHKGAKKILVEKPGAVTVEQSERNQLLARECNAFVRIAYNRRYYQSVLTLKRILREERPICACFDFTEWSSTIPPLPKSDLVKSRWATGNSVHVIDTVEYLLGPLHQLRCHISGHNKLSWHSTGAVFTGTALCNEVPVTYCTSWLSPGRWDIQVMTENGRYKLSPMEKLQVLRHNTVNWMDVEIDYTVDKQFKPGLFAMLTSFAREAMAPGFVGACELPGYHDNARTLEAIRQIVGYPE